VVVHVAPSRKSCEDEAEDGRVNMTSYVRPYYRYFVVFIVLSPRGILVFYSFAWAYRYDPRA
jgi:hypothetical protein